MDGGPDGYMPGGGCIAVGGAEYGLPGGDIEPLSGAVSANVEARITLANGSIGGGSVPHWARADVVNMDRTVTRIIAIATTNRPDASRDLCNFG